jgi:hypothetical protein
MNEHRLKVFENWVLRGIFVPKRDEVTEGYNLFLPPSIIRMIKPRRMRWVGHVA